MAGAKRNIGNVKRPVGPARSVGALKPVAPGGMAKMPTTANAVRRPDMSKVQKPVGPARPVGAISGPTRAGGMAKMPTTGGAARRPDMNRVQKPLKKRM